MLQLLISAVPFVVFFIGAIVSTLFAATGLLTLLLLCAAAYTEQQRRRIERDHPPRGRFVTVRGVRMHVLEAGAEHGGTPVVLLHGAASNADDMMVSAGAALTGRHVIAIDRPGHGYSQRPAPRDASSPIVQSRLIHEALEAIGVREAIVVGHSWGGCCALTLALRYPGTVRGLLLLAPVTHPWRGKISWYWRLAANRWFGPLFYRTLVMPVGLTSIRPTLTYVFAPNPVPERYIERAGITRIFRPANFAANAEDMVDLWDNVNWLSSQYPSIAAPAIILQGDKDGTLWPELHAESLVRQMPNARLTMLPEVGHLPNYFAKDEIAQAVAELDEDEVTEEGAALHVA